MQKFIWHKKFTHAYSVDVFMVAGAVEYTHYTKKGKH